MTLCVDDVRAMYNSNRTDGEIQMFIDDASLIVNESVLPKCSMTAERSALITKYLTLHLMTLADTNTSGVTGSGALKSQKIGDASESYETAGFETPGFNSTRWGQMAIAIDPCGTLAGLQTNNGLKAQFRVV